MEGKFSHMRCQFQPRSASGGLGRGPQVDSTVRIIEAHRGRCFDAPDSAVSILRTLFGSAVIQVPKIQHVLGGNCQAGDENETSGVNIPGKSAYGKMYSDSSVLSV
jgi:hypothetical protein